MLRNEKHMILDRIPRRFCDGPFWGNGTIGTVLYFREGKLVLSVDHSGLWENRESLPDEPRADFAAILENREAYKRGDPAYVEDTNIFDRAIGRTKLPALSVEFDLPSRVTGFVSDTDFSTAEGFIRLAFENGREAECRVRVDSCVNVLYLVFQGLSAEELNPEAKGWNLDSPNLSVLKRWGYPPCVSRSDKDSFFADQRFSGDRRAVIYGEKTPDGDCVRIAAGIGLSSDESGDEAGQAVKDLVRDYLDNFCRYGRRHREDWEHFWNRFDIRVPNERVQEAFWQEMYKLYCNERPDNSPVTLQGIWNTPERMPAWFGDLHNDLNVQACYWPAYKTGNVDLIQPYIDVYFRAMPRFEERAFKLFGVRDAVHIPLMMSPEGYGAASEWCFWNTVYGPELFVAVDFFWYYEFSRDDERLKEKIWPFAEKVVNLYQGIAVPGEDGFLHLPFMMSPEYDAGEGVMMEQDPTFALASLRYICEKLEKYGEKAGRDGSEYVAWSRRLVPVRTDETGFPVFAGIDHFCSHRHFCQMFPVFPLGQEAHNEIADLSLDRAINLGFLEYAAFSFPYLGIMGARCGRGNLCRSMLEIYCMTFRSRNSFTVNGDPYRNGVIRVSPTSAGESADAFTLESGFFIPTLLCEMFVHRVGDDLWLLPALPDEWKEASCRTLTVEGGHRISLDLQDYHLSRAVIEAASGDRLTVRVPENVRAVSVAVNGCPAELPADGITLCLKAGDLAEIRFAEKKD